MHIHVRDLLAEETGSNRTFAIEGEQPQTLSLQLTQPVNGEITIVKLGDERLAASGRIATQLQLECHRCLRSYTSDAEADFEQIYAGRPTEDELPIEDEAIDLAPLIEQELILRQPIKLLCQADCAGVPGAEEYLTKGLS
jgi:uncharacterized metal-binding protein YceD (DUF177 family)